MDKSDTHGPELRLYGGLASFPISIKVDEVNGMEINEMYGNAVGTYVMNCRCAYMTYKIEKGISAYVYYRDTR